MSIINSLILSESSFKEALTHKGNVGKINEIVDEVGLIDLKLPSDMFGGIAIKFLNVRFGDFRGLSKRSGLLLKKLLEYLNYF